MMSRLHGDSAAITWSQLARALCEVTCGTPARVDGVKSEPCVACAAKATVIVEAMQKDLSYRNAWRPC